MNESIQHFAGFRIKKFEEIRKNFMSERCRYSSGAISLSIRLAMR